MIFVFKVLTAPVLIAILTWATKRFGNAFVGLLMGIPLLTGPISGILSWEAGAAFAAKAAVSNLVGQVSTCLFCFVYFIASRRNLNCWMCVAVGISTFVVFTALWQFVEWTLPKALLLLVISIFLLLQFMHPVIVKSPLPARPVWDLPVRIGLSSAFVFLVTTVSQEVGENLSGLIAPFPVLVLIFSVFTHKQAGAEHVANLLRGIVLGSLCFASFFSVVAYGLQKFNPVFVYTAATASSVIVGSVLQRKIR